MTEERVVLTPEVLWDADDPWSPPDRHFLEEAAVYLERPTFLIRAASLVGRPIEALVGFLPEERRKALGEAVHKALERGLDVAVRSLGESGGPTDPGSPAARLRRIRHNAAAAAAGACGGLFGWAGLAIELPVTTTLMLRSIAAVARENGEDLGRPETRLECLGVLSHGAPSPSDDAMESSYLAIRTGMTDAIRSAAQYVARHGAHGLDEALRRGGVPVLVRLIARIAARFNVVVTEKAVAEAIPVVGAAGGALINAAFTAHFQQVAHYHFGIRRLERRHGEERVRDAYRAVAARARAPRS